MSNTTFKSVKSVDEHFSELNVSGNAVVHERLFVKDLIATNVVYAGENEIKEIELTASFTGGVASGTVFLQKDGSNWQPSVAISIVAAELSFTGSLGTGGLNIGTTSSATSSTNIFSSANKSPVRVSVYSQSLASSGSPSEQAMSTGEFITVKNTALVAASDVDIKLKVFYYETS